jgi:hypothetical protein
MLSLTEGYLSPCPAPPLSWLSPSPTGNKESLGQITPLRVVTFVVYSYSYIL